MNLAARVTRPKVSSVMAFCEEVGLQRNAFVDAIPLLNEVVLTRFPL